jgi:beta-glucosidase
VRGEFAVRFEDPSGASVDTSANRLTWFWDTSPAEGIDMTKFSAHISGALVPDATGDWEIGVRAVGPVTVSVDGEPVVAIDEPMRGGAFFGMGSPEVRGTVPLEEGRRYELTVEYPVSPEGERVRGLAVGARRVPDGGHIERAAAVAAGADVAVVVVGTDDDWETEGEDRAGLALPLDQDDLVAAVVAANPNTIVVVNTGSPVTMPWLASVPAVLQLWFPGQELGDALVDVLTGAAEPGGRLPVTFPRRLEDTPAFDHYPGAGDGTAVYAEGLLIGHRWYDREDIDPLFPFGHGLGYTTFELGVASVGGGVEHGVEVTVDVRNTGSRRGSEVVQLYVEPPAGDAARPLRTLAGFARIDLDPGEQGTVAVTLGRRAFASWLDGAWTVAPGEYVIHAGRSSRDLARAGAITVESPSE